VAALIDTNIWYTADGSVRLPHQAIVECIAAVTRPVRGYSILKQTDALREAEEFLQFTVPYPNEAILRTAIRGCAVVNPFVGPNHLASPQPPSRI